MKKTSKNPNQAHAKARVMEMVSKNMDLKRKFGESLIKLIHCPGNDNGKGSFLRTLVWQGDDIVHVTYDWDKGETSEREKVGLHTAVQLLKILENKEEEGSLDNVSQ